ncbi:hypothetical protein FNV43_RR13022 [Rhamnella rubrinervis]|uniref:At2g29880-like C-terminal domain-containing protein n=1 Tax=Rhamnella rubrinervis TaxID=2594499 RepID=A0A8K0H0D9_9ROSA|nr:hypothetical protein FNV43_RR13022 [Rhamnella rubrinervis]
MESHSIGLREDTDTRTFKVEDNKIGSLDDLEYDPLTETFIQSDAHETLPQSLSLGDFTQQPINLEVLPTTRKRNRMEVDGKLGSIEANGNHSNAINKLTQSISKFKQTIDSIDVRQLCYWDVIKEIPNLDNRACFKALKLLNTKASQVDETSKSAQALYQLGTSGNISTIELHACVAHPESFNSIFKLCTSLTSQIRALLNHLLLLTCLPFLEALLRRKTHEEAFQPPNVSEGLHKPSNHPSHDGRPPTCLFQTEYGKAPASEAFHKHVIVERLAFATDLYMKKSEPESGRTIHCETFKASTTTSLEGYQDVSDGKARYGRPHLVDLSKWQLSMATHI